MNKMKNAIRIMLGGVAQGTNESTAYNTHKIGRTTIVIPVGMRMTEQRKEFFKAIADGCQYTFKNSVDKIKVFATTPDSVDKVVLEFKTLVDPDNTLPIDNILPEVKVEETQSYGVYRCKTCDLGFISLITAEKHCKEYKHNGGIRYERSN